MAFTNRIRLPFKVTQPQYTESKEIYVKANGDEKTLSVRVTKTYQGITDLLPEKLHDRLKIALAHDTVNVEGEKYIGGISQNGDYQIEWPDFLDYPLGQAKFKVNVTPFDASNNNCGICDEEFTQVVAVNDDIGTVLEDTTYTVHVLDNDSVCCYPASISLVTFNTNFVDTCTIVGNDIVIHTKASMITQADVVLVTYRVSCENGLYDEADIIADTQGSIATCPAPTNLATTGGSPSSREVIYTWDIMNNATNYEWFVYLSTDLINPVQTGTTGNGNNNSVVVSGLTPDTSYRFCVRTICGGLSSSSSFTCADFTTLVDNETCGKYQLVTFVGGIVIASYINCNGDNFSQFMNGFGRPVTICALQNGPGNYVSITADHAIGITYLGLC